MLQVIIVGLLSIATLVDATACTSTQLAQLTVVADAYFSSPDCAGSALDSSTKSVAAICGGACMKLARQLAPDTPDCEFDDSNLGETIKNMVQLCDGTSGSGSSSTASSTPRLGSVMSNSTNTTGHVEKCTTADIKLITELGTVAQNNADCMGSGGAVASASSRASYCAESTCVAFVMDMESQLPNCTFGGKNIKQELADTLAPCNDPTATWAPSTTSPTATRPTTTTTPTVTTPIPTEASSQTTDAPVPTASLTSSLNPTAKIATVVVLAAIFLT